MAGSGSARVQRFFYNQMFFTGALLNCHGSDADPLGGSKEMDLRVHFRFLGQVIQWKAMKEDEFIMLQVNLTSGASSFDYNPSHLYYNVYGTGSIHSHASSSFRSSEI